MRGLYSEFLARATTGHLLGDHKDTRTIQGPWEAARETEGRRTELLAQGARPVSSAVGSGVGAFRNAAPAGHRDAARAGSTAKEGKGAAHA